MNEDQRITFIDVENNGVVVVTDLNSVPITAINQKIKRKLKQIFLKGILTIDCMYPY